MDSENYENSKMNLNKVDREKKSLKANRLYNCQHNHQLSLL